MHLLVEMTQKIEGLRRSKRIREVNTFGNYFDTYLTDNEPQTYFNAISPSEAPFWKEAIKTEIDFVAQYKTWILGDSPPETKSIGCKWIFERRLSLTTLLKNTKLN